MKKIVIVGGAAGGLELTICLARRLGRRAGGAITLVDRKMTHMWKPLFHEVASGTRGHSGDEISYLSLAEMHGFRFRTGNLIAIDRQAQSVTISAAMPKPSSPSRNAPCLMTFWPWPLAASRAPSAHPAFRKTASSSIRWSRPT